VGSQSATPQSAGAEIQVRFQAANMYLVLTSAGNVPRRVQVLLDGRPVTPGSAGADVHGSFLTVSGQRLYSLVSRPGAEQHELALRVPPGVSAYSFTFG
jgi:hypothetical protein